VALEDLDTDQPRHQPQAVALVATEMRRGILVAGVWRDLPSQQGRTRVSTEAQSRLGLCRSSRRRTEARRSKRCSTRPAGLEAGREASKAPSGSGGRGRTARPCRPQSRPGRRPTSQDARRESAKTSWSLPPRAWHARGKRGPSCGNEVVAGLRGWGDISRIKLGKTFALASATRRCGARVSKVRCGTRLLGDCGAIGRGCGAGWVTADGAGEGSECRLDAGAERSDWV
jgi:hypothetical protein